MAKVLVACKMPNGLRLRLFDMISKDYPMFGGGLKTVTEAVFNGEEVVLNGNVAPWGSMPRYQVLGGADNANPGYAVTAVEESFWDRWLEQNKDSDLVKGGIVFAADRMRELHAQAVDQQDAGIKSGLEPLDPENPPRVIARDPKLGKKVKITPADEMPDYLFDNESPTGRVPPKQPIEQPRAPRPRTGPTIQRVQGNAAERINARARG